MPPNNYPFYNDDEKYVPITQADGGQLSGAAASPAFGPNMHALQVLPALWQKLGTDADRGTH